MVGKKTVSMTAREKRIRALPHIPLYRYQKTENAKAGQFQVHRYFPLFLQMIEISSGNMVFRPKNQISLRASHVNSVLSL